MKVKEQQEFIQNARQRLLNQIMLACGLLLLMSIGLLFYGIFGEALPKWSLASQNLNPKKIVVDPNEVPKTYFVDQVDLLSGLHQGEGMETVRAVCTACHSAKLITQNSASRLGWKEMITWMQQTQGLQDLGEQEDLILDYLATYYAPKELGRRANLEVEKWYKLSEGE